VVTILKESKVRNLTKALAAISLLVPASGHALGVGDIKLHSALNQNLKAEISLVVSAGEDVSNIHVKLASPEKFDEAGVPWSYFLSKIRFRPEVKANGSVVIKLTSTEALREPFLDFLLEVTWPQGNIYREFTVLVDPPTTYGSQSTTSTVSKRTSHPVAAPVEKAVAPVEKTAVSVEKDYEVIPESVKVEKAPLTNLAVALDRDGAVIGNNASPVGNNLSKSDAVVPSFEDKDGAVKTSPVVAQTVPRVEKPLIKNKSQNSPKVLTDKGVDKSRNEYGPTKKTSNLYRIANEVNPYSDIAVEQMMYAIYEANPDAFYNNNIHSLRAGQLLKIPNREQLEGVSRDKAVQAIGLQESTQKQASQQNADALGVNQTDNQAGKAAGTPKTQAVKRTKKRLTKLKLRVPKERKIAKKDKVFATKVADSEVVTQDKSKNLANASQDLQIQLRKVQDQLAAMEKLLILKDKKLALIEAGLKGKKAGEAPTIDAQALAKTDIELQKAQSIAIAAQKAMGNEVVAEQTKHPTESELKAKNEAEAKAKTDAAALKAKTEADEKLAKINAAALKPKTDVVEKAEPVNKVATNTATDEKAKAEAKAKADAAALKAKTEADEKLAKTNAAALKLKTDAAGKVEPVAKIDVSTVADTKAKTAAETKAKIDAEALKPKTDATGKTEPVAKVDAKTAAEVDAKAKAEADAKIKADAVAKAKAEADAKIKADAVAKAKVEADAKIKADAVAKAKAEADAKIKADTVAKAKAEADAKIKADTVAKADAKAKAEADAKIKADAAAKAKADAEALKVKTDAEAKVKAEADALKAKIEADAKIKADAAALKAKAEVEAKARAAAELKARAEAKLQVDAAALQAKAGGDASVDVQATNVVDVASPKPETKKPLLVVAPEPVETEDDWMLDPYTLTLMGGGVFSAGLLGWLFWRKRKVESVTEVESMFTESSEINLPDDEDEFSVAGIEDNSSFMFGGESSFLSDDNDFDAFEVDQDEVDPISEADVYLAYGRYQQAEELMRQAIEDQPERDECKLKLLEIFYANENATAFEAYVSELAKMGKASNVPFWTKVSEMGQGIIPDSPLLKMEEGDATQIDAQTAETSEGDEYNTDINLADTADNVTESNSEFDLSLFDEPATAQTVETDIETEESLADNDEFDLSMFDEPAAAEAVETEIAAEEPPANNDEFDLSMFDEPAAVEAVETEIATEELHVDDAFDLSMFDESAVEKVSEEPPANNVEFDLSMFDEPVAAEAVETVREEPPANNVEFDLSMFDEPVAAEAVETVREELPANNVEFDLSMFDEPVAAEAVETVREEPPANNVEFDLSMFDEPVAAEAVETVREEPPANNVEFDLSMFDEPVAAEAVEITAEPAAENNIEFNDLSMFDDDNSVESEDFDLSAFETVDPEKDDINVEMVDAIIKEDEDAFDLSSFDISESDAEQITDFDLTDEESEAFDFSSFDGIGADENTSDISTLDINSLENTFEIDSHSTDGLTEEGILDLADMDVLSTKIDLAKAYMDMGDKEAAKAIIDKVLAEGTEEQKNTARELLEVL